MSSSPQESAWLNRGSDLWRKSTVLCASERFRDWLSLLFIAVLVGVMLFPALHGDWPVGHDHPVHVFRIWQLGESLRQHWTPWTWSHRWFAGYPANVIYPVGADIFVLAVQALSLGTLSLGQAYGVAFWLFYFLYGVAAYIFVRRATGWRSAALLAVVGLLTEPGANDTGGWFWFVDLGVWTSGFGMIPALLGTIQLANLLEKPTPRTAGLLALCVGLALLCHPLNLIYFGLVLPTLLFSRYLAGEKTAWLAVLRQLGLAFFFGLLMASFWLIPYLSSLRYRADMGESGHNLQQLSDALVSDGLFRGMHVLPMVLGLLGALLALRTRRVLLIFTGLFVFICTIGASSYLANIVGTGAAAWLKKNIISGRLDMLAKPFWYGAAAFLLVSAWYGIRRAPSEPAPSDQSNRLHRLWRPILLTIFVCLFVLPIALPAARRFYLNEIARPTQWQSQRDNLNARQAAAAYIKDIFSQKQGFFRIAYGFEPNDDLSDLGIDLPCPLYKISFTPSGHFKYSVASFTPDVFRALNVRYALAEHPIKPPRPDFRLVRTFENRLWLYDVTNWNPLPFEINGTGPVELKEFSDEEIVLFAGEGARGTLRLNVTNYPKWHATRDNQPIPIASATAAGFKNSAFMQVELAPGTYRFRYRRGLSDYAGTLLCLIGLAGCVFLLSSRDPLGWKRRFLNWNETAA